MNKGQSEGPRNPRRDSEKDASQAMGGQPRSAHDEDALQKPEQAPSNLTAQELQGWQRPKAGETHGSASSSGSKGEPRISNDEPARGKRGQTQSRTHKLEDDE